MRDPIQDIARQLGITTFGDGLLTKIRETIDLLQSDANNLMQYKEVAAELEAELAKAHEYGYQYRQERNRAEAELAAFKAQVPVAEVDKTVPSAEIQWTDHGEEMCLPHGTKLYAAPAQPQSDGVIVPRQLLDRFPEINMSNFGADEVELLNDWGIEVSMLGGDHE